MSNLVEVGMKVQSLSSLRHGRISSGDTLVVDELDDEGFFVSHSNGVGWYFHNSEHNKNFKILTEDPIKKPEPTTGLKFDTTKPDMSLLPAAALIEEASLWTFGKEKYAAYNWHKGFQFGRVVAAMQRHLTLFNAGIDVDDESKRLHLAAIRCGAAMLIQFTLEKRFDLDDRMKMSEETKKNLELMSKGEMIWDLITNKKESK